MKSASAALSAIGTRFAALADKGAKVTASEAAQKIDKAIQRFVVMPIPGFY
jgi:hypothetical protein